MAERILTAQEDLCLALQKTNQLIETSIENQQTSFETLSNKLDALIELKRKEVEILQMRMEWEVEK